MTRHRRPAALPFLVAALVVALGLLAPQPAGAYDPFSAYDTSAGVTRAAAGNEIVGATRIHANDTVRFCSVVGDVQRTVTETTASFSFTSICALRTMIILHREVDPAPFSDGQIIEENEATQHTLSFPALTPATGYRYSLLIVPKTGGSAIEFDAGRFETLNAKLLRLKVTELGFNEFGPLTRFDLQTSHAADTKIVLWAYGVPTRRIAVPNPAAGASVTVQSQEDCRTYAYQITVNGQVAKQGTFQTARPNYGCHDAIPFPSPNPNA